MQLCGVWKQGRACRFLSKFGLFGCTTHSRRVLCSLTNATPRLIAVRAHHEPSYGAIQIRMERESYEYNLLYNVVKSSYAVKIPLPVVSVNGFDFVENDLYMYRMGMAVDDGPDGRRATEGVARIITHSARGT